MNNIETLNTLIETLKDGQAGFKAAEEDAQSPELRSLFSTFSQQRATFAAELQRLARAYGDPKPEDSGSTGGALHRGWINLKAAVVKRNAHAILAECERGEDAAVEVYKKALNEPDLSSEVRETLVTQFSEVQAAHDRVRDLRDSTADE